MLQEHGIVKLVEGTSAWVETRRQTACGGCSMNKGCGTGILASVLGERRTRVKALNACKAKAGDKVVLELQEEALLKGSLVIYMWPLVGLLSGALFGTWLQQYLGSGDNELPALVAGAVGLWAGFARVRRFNRRIAEDAQYQPVVSRILGGDVAAFSPMVSEIINGEVRN